MKPSKFDHDRAMVALWNFSDYRPDFDSRGSYIVGTTDCMIADAISICDDTAGTWACADNTAYSRQRFEDALSFLISETHGHVKMRVAQVNDPAQTRVKGPAQTPATPNSRSQLRKMAALDRWARCAVDPEFKALCEGYGLTVKAP